MINSGREWDWMDDVPYDDNEVEPDSQYTNNDLEEKKKTSKVG